MEILAKIHENFAAKARKAVGTASLVSTTQFHGIDKDPFAVELAKVTLMLGKRMALAEVEDTWFSKSDELPFEFEKPLPLDNLDDFVRCDDALFVDWPKANFIIGNPPYQSKNKMQEEYGRAYLNEVRERYSDVPGMADYCVYWFRRAHDELPPGGNAGLVGTNTIRQTYSRRGGLDYIVQNNGTITEAVSTQVWSGDAVVHVSIVNWTKGKADGDKQLFTQLGDDRDSPWSVAKLSKIPSSLTAECDVSQARKLAVNANATVCYQGQTPGHEGFLIPKEEAAQILVKDNRNNDVLKPYLTGDELLSYCPPQPQRYVIDFQRKSLTEASRYADLLHRIQNTVLPDREKAAKKEETRNKEAREKNAKARVNRHHANFLRSWWKLGYGREELIEQISKLTRYIVCSRVTKRPVFEFVSSDIRPSDALYAF